MKKIVVLLILSLFIFSCFYKGNITEDLQQEITHTGEENLSSAWVVYWDLEKGLDEIEYINNSIKEISYFAAYFKENNEIFIPNNINEAHIKYKSENKGGVHYLSIVNDKLNLDGTSSLKDKQLLYDLLEDKNTRQQHIDSLVNLCIENNYDGLEIDYEGLKDDDKLWTYFAQFCGHLYEQLTKNNLKVKIVLEPFAPINKYNFPKGPNYVIMCYNLHGPHNGPGPKANIQFLNDLFDEYNNILENVTFALATGGFSWNQDGQVKAITEEEALELLAINNINVIRDEKSKCVFFKYMDSNNLEQEVWFADEITLKSWINALKQKGAKNFSLWRLGGNYKKTLANLKSIL